MTSNIESKSEIRTTVSVVMTCYNHEKYIVSAVQSVLDQTFPDFELIIIDDGSTDGTRDMLKTFNDDRIRLIFQENEGPGSACNAGLNIVSGEFIALMSGDDVCYPERLEKQLSYSKKSKAAFFWPIVK